MRQLALCSVLILLPACQTGSISVWSCENPCKECEDPCHPDPCAGGECVPLPSLGWTGPVLLWTGDPDDAPPCPARAANQVWEGYDGLVAEPECPSCTCGPSACGLSGLIANSADGLCPAAGSETPFPPPEDWTGACVAGPLIDAADVGSIQFPPLTEAPCEPQTGTIPEASSYRWATLARACQSSDPVTACDETSLCVPTSEPPPPGFSQCLFNQEEQTACPRGYPERRVFYTGIDTSSVGCTECQCSPPEGGICQATVRGYDDAACSIEVGSAAVGLNGPQCVDTMSSFDIQSMSATWIVNQPGACTPSGGEPFGEAKPAYPGTFCCQVKPKG